MSVPNTFWMALVHSGSSGLIFPFLYVHFPLPFYSFLPPKKARCNMEGNKWCPSILWLFNTLCCVLADHCPPTIVSFLHCINGKIVDLKFSVIWDPSLFFKLLLWTYCFIYLMSFNLFVVIFCFILCISNHISGAIVKWSLGKVASSTIFKVRLKCWKSIRNAERNKKQ